MTRPSISRWTLQPAAALVSLLALSAPALAQPHFSIDVSSPTAASVSNSAVLGSGSVEVFSAASLGAAGGGVDDIDAMTSGGTTGMLHLSVSRSFAGSSACEDLQLPFEAVSGQASGDVFVAGSFVDNQLPYLRINQADLGLLPASAAGTPEAGPIDDIDALDLGTGPPTLISFIAGHPYLGTASVAGCGSDLFAPGSPPSLAVSHTTLGLTCADEIDALHLDSATGDLYVSLANGSPTLPTGVAGCTASQPCEGGTVLYSAGGTTPLSRDFPFFFRIQYDGVEIDALAGPVSPGLTGDADGDGVDDSVDNCLGLVNRDQRDSNFDGFGNLCDADLDDTGGVAISDFLILRDKFGLALCGLFGDWIHEVDMGGSGGITISNFLILKNQFTHPPGPSGLACAGSPPCSY